MAKFAPTKDQQRAIDARGSALLISAAAGSGKTKVLTERLMSYITGEDPKSIDSFLVITFTRAAAGELRSRIMQELTERMRGGGVDMSRVTRTESVADALGLALRESLRSDAQPVRIIVFGSFVTVAAAVEELRHSLAVKISP